eukprot:scaffold8964_cov54-Phaeocystis_antarctica.AAC.1
MAGPGSRTFAHTEQPSVPRVDHVARAELELERRRASVEGGGEHLLAPRQQLAHVVHPHGRALLRLALALLRHVRLVHRVLDGLGRRLGLLLWLDGDRAGRLLRDHCGPPLSDRDAGAAERLLQLHRVVDLRRMRVDHAQYAGEHPHRRTLSRGRGEELGERDRDI